MTAGSKYQIEVINAFSGANDTAIDASSPDKVGASPTQETYFLKYI